MKITLNIDPKVIERIEANREDITAAVDRAAAKAAAELMNGMPREYNRMMAESFRRQFKRHQRTQRRIRIVLDELPYIGGGIITGTHKRR